jgi:hypothetical protein
VPVTPMKNSQKNSQLNAGNKNTTAKNQVKTTPKKVHRDQVS